MRITIIIFFDPKKSHNRRKAHIYTYNYDQNSDRTGRHMWKETQQYAAGLEELLPLRSGNAL